MINAEIASISPAAPQAATVYRGLNVEFHKQLHAMSHSPIVCARQLANFELSDFYLAQTGGFRMHLPRVGDEHQEIITALARRDAAAAGRSAREHIESVARNVIAAMAAL
jgi:DNA-binding GntR family transcriptional regulator